MITEKEIEISNMSYTNKQFDEIYTELVDLTKKLTKIWDPEKTNESDVGIVLLKLMAFMGDKTNYNVDKNILESYMPSVTQRNNMIKLCNMLAYNPKYYMSATTNISVMYKGDLASGDYIQLNPFETSFTDVDNTITYTLIPNNLNQNITEKNVTYTFDSIEGTYERFKLNDDRELVQIDDLDDNNRLFFDVKNIAQNGVFVKVGSGDYWKIVDNLNTQEMGSAVYKFGYDSTRDLPYLEFPSDIANLIGEGLSIGYIITKGFNGNVQSGFISKIAKPSIIKSNGGTEVYNSTNTTSTFVIANLSSTNNGADIETINEAYNNFKRTQGTFDTLVTCRDYANAIYNMFNASNINLPLVSNAQVCDRRSDINYSNYVLSYNIYGQFKQNNIINNNINAFDLCLYPLQYVNSMYDEESYKNSFNPLNNTLEIIYNLEDSKSISHNYKNLSDNDIYLIKNKYRLNVRLTTTYKVNSLERDNILDNVNKALFNNFNPRKLEYGEEIPYDTLLSVIKNADSRIKSVSLAEPDVVPYAMLKSGLEFDLTSSTNSGTLSDESKLFIDIVAKNILQGKVSLFDYDNRFKYKWGQSAVTGSSSTVIDDVASVTTQVTINSAGTLSNGGYTLDKNEVVQIVSPYFVEEKTYTANVYYHYNGITVSPNSYHKLGAGEELIFAYRDSNNKLISVPYTTNTIIKPNFNLTATNNTINQKYIDENNRIYYSTGSTNEISIVSKVETNFGSESTTVLPCYWYRNNSDNALFTSNDYNIDTNKYEIILDNNEYFVYTNSSYTELSVIGSGNKLVLTDASFNANDWKLDDTQLISLEDINTNGLAAFTTYNWKDVTFTSTKQLDITDMELLTLIEGDVIKITQSGSTTVFDLTNTLTSLGDLSVEYKFKGDTDFSPLETININDEGYKIRSRFDLNVGPDLLQSITQTDNKTQSITFGNDVTIYSGSILSSELLQMSGGNNRDIKVTTLSGNVSYIDFLNLNYLDVTFTDISSTTRKLLPNKYNNLLIKVSDLQQSTNITLNFLHMSDADNQIAMFYINKVDDSAATYTLSCGSGDTLSFYNSLSGPSTSLTLDSGVNIIDLKNVSSGSVNLNITRGSDDAYDSVVIGEIKNVSDYNDKLGLTDYEIQDATGCLLSRLRTLGTKDGKDIFYYNADIDNTYDIDVDNLRDFDAYWSYNNIANKMTLPQIDFEHSSIAIAKSSLL